MTTSRSTLIISTIALILLALVPAVSANEIVYDEDLVEYVYTGESGQQTDQRGVGETDNCRLDTIVFKDITKAQTLYYLVFEVPGDQGKWKNGTKISDGGHPFTYIFNGEEYTGGVVNVSRKTNLLGQVTSTVFTVFLNDWDIGDFTGTKSVSCPFYFYYGHGYGGTRYSNVNVYLSGEYITTSTIKITVVTAIQWKHHITVEQDSTSYYITIDGVIDGKYYNAEVEFSKDGEVFTSFANTGKELYFAYPKQDIDLIRIISPGGKIYPYSLESDIPVEPTPTLRTGTVTMTDHNGTTISNFEVKAVNYYTGEEYTVSTDTDVATITLPMDRTIALRNPQTGQYEDVPVGYYTFFVSKPGYKMTSEDGVRISVMPVEYSSYHLGDIIVTPEDGYLTGKHQFQIRSRADLSILQTGTISAQSAKTGEWYNTTVTDGIATLILPYDTSNPYYEYVGNYYVYATSPGYIPSEYATQISVRPDTQSEIRWILLTPIGGIPEAGNVTLRIQAVSDSGQGIPNAQIHIDGLAGAGWEVWDTYTASSTGYAEISVPENSTYDITVYGEGYYSSSQRIEVGDTDPPLMEFKLYPTAPALTPPTTQPTGWITPPPTTQPSPGIPDEDDDSEGFLMEAIRGISRAFGVGFATGKTIFGMLLALAIGFTTAKQLRGGAAEFGLGLLGGTMLGVLIGLLPVWVVVVLLLIVGMYVGYRYVGGSSNG